MSRLGRGGVLTGRGIRKPEVLEMFSILTYMVITWVYTCKKINGVVHLRLVHFRGCILYLNKKKKNQYKEGLSLILSVQRDLFINFTKTAHYKMAPLLIPTVTKHCS